jgi:CBS domain-containing protein
MNAGNFMVEKSKCCYLYSDYSIDEALEKMAKFRYQTVPVIERGSGRYLYAISEGDILYKIKDSDLPYDEAANLPISSVDMQRLHIAVRSIAELDELAELIVNQNFIPVVDDAGLFQGIVTRKAIIYYLLGLYNKPQPSKD